MHTPQVSQPNSQPVAPVFKSVNRFCEDHDMSPASFYRLVAAGRLRPVKRGRRTLVHWTEEERYSRTLIEAA